MTQSSPVYVEDTSAAKLRASDAGVRRFVESRFGLSVHWGLYSINGRGEWVLHLERIPHETYRGRMKEFNPTRFNAEEWADLMLESGQKFLLITTKHHDGFCLWDSSLTDFKVTNTPFKRDVIGELAPALRDRGLGLHFYYSLMDWTHPAYRSDWPAYVAYYQGQLRELLTRYGPVAGVLFDGYWPRGDFKPENGHFLPADSWTRGRGYDRKLTFDLAGTYDLIHALQPDAVVTNNGHVLPTKGEDYQVWELDMPGENSIGFNTTQVGALPTAAWWNLNAGWAYAPRTHAVKDPAEIAGLVRRARDRGCAFLLNVGPRPWGDIHPEEQLALRKIGQVLRPT